ncbi:MAG: nicotinate (nicotinamide) nucleotide adenylyltransferase [Bacteroidales bacterium]
MTKDKHIGLFFGSFNPIHNGHLMIANWMVEYTDLDQVWFVVSPLSPFKTTNSLLPDYQRLELVNRAIGDDPRFKASNIEFNLPKPSYTIDTLVHLKEQHPDYQFILIMGSDQLPDLHRWKDPERILEEHRLFVYPRKGNQFTIYDLPFTGDNGQDGNGSPVTGHRSPVENHELLAHPSVTLVDAPLIEISASFIRSAIREGRDVRHFLPPAVWAYVREMHFFEGPNP